MRRGHTAHSIGMPMPSHPHRPVLMGHDPGELTGLNRTWVSADLSARQTFARPKVRFNPYRSIFWAEKTAGLSAGRKSGLFLPPPPLVLIPPYTNNPPGIPIT